MKVASVLQNYFKELVPKKLLGNLEIRIMPKHKTDF